MSVGPLATSPKSAGKSLLIVGASTRAAAHSAIRAGWRPCCADLFADADLTAIAQVIEVADYPHGLIAAAESAPPGPWIFTGGMENHPGLVAKISRNRPLWGNGPAELKSSRDPWFIHQLLIDAGLPALNVWPRASSPPSVGTWMRKPLRGSAGRGISVWDESARSAVKRSEPCCFQRRADGIPISAVFIADANGVRLAGVTRQLIGLPEVNAPPFAWCGTIAPFPVATDVRSRIADIGRAIGRACRLRGLFGCDFLLDGDVPWLTEVNPRYTAAVELVESLSGIPLLEAHIAACASFDRDSAGTLQRPMSDEPKPADGVRLEAIHGKIVLYADVDLVARDLTRWIHTPQPDRLPFVADIPRPGQRIPRSQPVCTLFARAHTETECEQKLLRRAAMIRRLFFPAAR